jgi:hypothetical protein
MTISFGEFTVWLVTDEQPLIRYAFDDDLPAVYDHLLVAPTPVVTRRLHGDNNRVPAVWL